MALPGFHNFISVILSFKCHPIQWKRLVPHAFAVTISLILYSRINRVMSINMTSIVHFELIKILLVFNCFLNKSFKEINQTSVIWFASIMLWVDFVFCLRDLYFMLIQPWFAIIIISPLKLHVPDLYDYKEDRMTNKYY